MKLKLYKSHNINLFHLSDRWSIYLFIMPALFFCILIIAYPIFYSFRLSLYDWSGFGNAWKSFVGLSNFITLFSKDLFFKRALLNTVIFTIGHTVLLTILGLFLAVLVDSVTRGKAFFRTIIFLPLILSVVMVGLLWANILSDPNFGLFNRILDSIGLSNLKQVWLAKYPLSLFIIILASVWHQVGFSLVIFLAGLQGIPIELVEAAKIDGADNFKIIRYITIPLLRGTTGLVLALTTISGVKVFDYVFIMTMGGPAHSTEVLGSYLFQKGFILNKMGEASAIAVILMLIALVCAIFLFRVIATKES